MSRSERIIRLVLYAFSPAWILDITVRDPRKRFFVSEFIAALLILPFFTLIGLAIMAVLPTILLLVIWGLLSLWLPYDIANTMKFIIYVVFLFASGWGLGNGIRDLVFQAKETWERDKDEITACGYRTYRLDHRRWA